MKLPDYLILGETKCGTTSLFNYLIKHPKILPSKGNHIDYDDEYNTKEVRYYDRFYSKGIEWYMQCFPHTSEGYITGEATPMYFYRTLSIHRIKNDIPNAKFIVLLRNPVDRLYSNFNHNFKWVPGFKEKYSNFSMFWNSVHDVDYYLIEKGLYYHTFLKWFAFFKRSQFHIIKSENLFNNTQYEYSKTLEFLGVGDFQLKDVKIFRKNVYNDINEEIREEITNFYSPYNEKLYNLLSNFEEWE